MQEITSADVLREYLVQVQSLRMSEARCRLSIGFAARITKGQVQRILDETLSLVQGRTWQMKRLRGGGAEVLAHLTYRDGLRMAAGRLPVPDLAWVVAQEAARRYPDPMHRFCWLYALVARGVTYVHTKPGAVGYQRLVGASGVLETGQGNCQGFADVLFLLGQLSGLEMEVCIGPTQRGLHAWNRVLLEGQWAASDASRGSRGWRKDGLPGMLPTCLMDAQGGSLLQETQCIEEIMASACDFFHDFTRKCENPPFPNPEDVI